MTTKDSKSRPGNGDVRALLKVMADLRDPDTGCPWDIEQDFASIAPYTIEEAYEVADAISRNDALDLCDELGDLLLQVVYHAQMASERGLFDFDDCAAAITKKMIRRHPHVFGSPAERAEGPTKGSWDRIKLLEKLERKSQRAALPAVKTTLVCEEPSTRPEPTATDIGNPTPTDRTLDGVPQALPALNRAVKLQSKAAKVGFDWPSLTPVFAKMKEELAELESAHKENDALEASADVIEEFGDLLFVMANVARHMKIDPEAALRDANAKFTRRFAGIEDRLAEKGKTPAQSDLAEMDELWDAVKVAEKKAR